ncbi:MAG: winged helix-turn-helix transcriptional regulator [Hydrogenothermaceae bacterium]
MARHKRNLIFCKWALSILRCLLEGPKRPSQIKREILDITDRILYDRLNKLLKIGLIKKRVITRRPPLTIYLLSDESSIYNVLSQIYSKDMSVCDEKLINLISNKYTISIMNILEEEKTPKHIKAKIDISNKELHRLLSNLESYGFVKRNIYDQKPIKVTYVLTFAGREILPALNMLKSFILSK